MLSLPELVEAKCLVQNVQRGVHIPVMMGSALRARPFAFGQSQARIRVSASMAELGAWVEPIHTDERATVPFRLIGELVHKGAPTLAENGTVHRAFAGLPVTHGLAVSVKLLPRFSCHVPHHQGLHADELVIFNQPMRCLMLEIITIMTEFRVCFGYDCLLLMIVV